MDFEKIENMSEEEVLEMYDDATLLSCLGGCADGTIVENRIDCTDAWGGNAYEDPSFLPPSLSRDCKVPYNCTREEVVRDIIPYAQINAIRLDNGVMNLMVGMFCDGGGYLRLPSHGGVRFHFGNH